MTLRVTLHPSGHEFTTEDGETVLDAALRAGVHLPYGCRNGACGACKAQIAEGMVDHGNAMLHALSTEERDRGLTLLCCATPRTDLVVEAPEVQVEQDIRPRMLPSRVETLERVSDDVVVLRVRLPADERLMFMPGQYVDILLADGGRRSYSMANPPHDDGALEFHIRHVAGGHFSEHVFSGLKPGDILRFEGPHGSFWLQEDSDRPIIMLAGGTGFAPIKAMLEHAFHVGIDRPVVLYRGAHNAGALYLTDLSDAWAAEGRLRLETVLSEPGPNLTGRSGLLHEAVLADFPDLSRHEVYACGAPAMVEAAHGAFTRQAGLPEKAFFSDAFFPATTPA